ncbi:MAG: cell surface protein [Lachnospiraceae bacterium]|nr:cell surface protein [Lachnospiraceae bacterium]
MKYSKRYLVFTLLIVILIGIKLNNWSDEYAVVTEFRGAHLKDEVFYPLIAKNINDNKLLTLSVDGNAVGINGSEVYVSDNMTVMAELSFIRDLMDCSARLYNGKKIVLKRNGKEYDFSVGHDIGSLSAGKMELSHAPEYKDNKCYMPLPDLCNEFGYGYNFNRQSYTLNLTKTGATDSYLPSRFDLRNEGRISSIKDQGNQSTCWAYAALGALESSSMPEETLDYSAEHLIFNNTYSRSAEAGGDYRVAASYFLSWNGPASEDGDQTMKHIQECRFYTEDEVDDIKWAVYKYGGVSTSLYVDVTEDSLKGSSYYNRGTNSYYYDGSNVPNHDVIIIGWDDSYEASDFYNPPGGNGAFICQNSWGTKFGEEGVFYVSYYDTNIGKSAVSYVKVEDTDNYDNIYQSDLCGQIGTMGFSKDTIYAANVFTAGSDETIEAAGFYAVGKNTHYRIAVVPNYNNPSDLYSAETMVSGTVPDKGYYTIRFRQGRDVLRDRKFAIVVELQTPDAVRPLAIEYETDKTGGVADISDGEGYVSNNGIEWERIEKEYEANVCLKAYTSGKVK